MTTFGYMRVSTSKKDESGQFIQTMDSQRDALIAAGVPAANIFEDRISGKTRVRPGLDALLNAVRQGDEILLWKLDRLGRSVRNLLEVAETLKNKSVSIRSLTDGIDTKGPLGGFLLTILGAVAELERDTISERVKAGITASKASGGAGPGRRKTLSVSARRDIVASYDAGETVAELSKRYKTSRSTINRALLEHENKATLQKKR